MCRRLLSLGVVVALLADLTRGLEERVRYELVMWTVL